MTISTSNPSVASGPSAPDTDRGTVWAPLNTRPALPLLVSERWILIALLLIGAALILFRFPAVPWGLHQDEMSEAYESYALLRTGADRWGYHLPVYFLSWGSGQNVMQAYLNIPFIAALGLTRWGARLLPMLLNVACLPLFFFAVRRWYGTRPALLALAFLVFSPWHIMLSRWGIENNPLPFFFALGLLTFSWAAGTASSWRILPCLLPFVLAMYTYGMVIVMVPPFVLLLLWLDFPAVRRSLGLWVIAVALFFLLSLPLIIFTIKNYVLKTNLGFERWLPFTIPLLPNSRLAEVNHYELSASSVLHHNLKVILYFSANHHGGFGHMLLASELPNVNALQTVVYLLFWLGFVVWLWRSLRARRPLEPFVPWLLACALIVKTVPINISRAGVFLLPILALGSSGFFHLLERTPSLLARRIAWAALAVFLLVPMARFAHAYYGPQYAKEIAPSFYPHLPTALAEAERVAGPNAPIYLPDGILLNYVDVLFLNKVDPVAFQHSGATWDHPNFGRYHFNSVSLPTIPHPFVYVVNDRTENFCAAPQQVSDYSDLKVGICP